MVFTSSHVNDKFNGSIKYLCGKNKGDGNTKGNELDTPELKIYSHEKSDHAKRKNDPHVAMVQKQINDPLQGKTQAYEKTMEPEYMTEKLFSQHSSIEHYSTLEVETIRGI